MLKFLIFFLVVVVIVIASYKSHSQTIKKNQMASNTNFNPLNLSEEDWKAKLSDEEYYILREKGTEKPFSGKFLMHKENGFYTCRACGEKLFSSDAKFDSHCGWPSFDNELEKGKIVYTEDHSHGMNRVEITCAKCGSHLGHVFNDGPTSTGLRYCVNSVSLAFESLKTSNEKLELMTIGGGCFWCTEAIFSRINGVEKVESGYSGGHIEKPTYKEVCSGNTGHAEVIQVTFNPNIISFEELLKVFFSTHNPTTLNRQGNDVGTQYRSVIFYHNELQKESALKIIDVLKNENVYDQPIVTQVEPFTVFYEAEDYHQNYFEENSKTNPYCEMIVQPKVDKFEKAFKTILKR